MTLLACVSVSGAPGVTTTALGLAACWPGDVTPLLAEADPSGGDIAGLFALPPSPGMVSLAAASRRPAGPGLAWQHAQRLDRRLAVLPGPPGAGQARATALALAAASWAPLTAAADGQEVIIADCGRAGPGSPVTGLLAAASELLVVTAAASGALAHVNASIRALRGLCPRTRLILTGPRGPYSQAEIEKALGAAVLAWLPHDPAGAAILRGQPAARGAAGWRRSPARLPLVAAASAAATAIAAAGTEGTGQRPGIAAQPAPAGGPRHGRPRPAIPARPGSSDTAAAPEWLSRPARDTNGARAGARS